MENSHADKVAFAMAACLVKFMPTLSRLPPPEQFDHLAAAIGAAIVNYRAGARDWYIPEPSVN